MIIKNVYGKNVIVTGASSGIGKICAEGLANIGCNVVGLALGCEEKTYNVGNGTIHLINCDVTKKEEVEKVFENIKEVDIALLAAGIGIAGPEEIMPVELARKQMEVNYFGVLNVCNFILPIMRNNRHGLVVAISSVGGRLALPMQGHYSSSKYALEAYMECLRIEMKDFNVKTCLIEPGDTKTGFTGARKTYNPESNPYYDICNNAVKRIAHDEQTGKDPKTVLDVLLKIIDKKEPPVRVAVGFSYKFVCFLAKILPSKLVDYLLYKMYIIH